MCSWHSLYLFPCVVGRLHVAELKVILLSLNSLDSMSWWVNLRERVLRGLKVAEVLATLYSSMVIHSEILADLRRVLPKLETGEETFN